jgi:glutathione S-transferase
MIEIFHAPRSRSNRAIWALEEMGVPYTVRSVARGEEKPPELYAHNPGGTLPLMVDGDTVIFESVTIMEYVAETYGPTPLALQLRDPDYWTYRQMLMFGEASLGGPLTAIVPTMLRGPEDQRQNYTAEVIRGSFKKRLGVVSLNLGTGPYIAGEAFTLADISVQYVLDLAQIPALGLGDLIPADVAAYSARLTERPAYQRMKTVK